MAGKAQRAGLAFVFLWFFIGGIAHFALTETEMRIVPPWVPWPRAAVLVSGVFELLGAAGLLWRPVRAGADLVPEEISALRAWEAEASASLRHGI